MGKYIALFSTHLKQAMAYRSDALLSGLMSFFRVMLSYLLWSMLIEKGGSLNGFTLSQMVTYSVLSAALSPFVLQSDTIFSFAQEIRTGRFSRFLYTPVKPLPVFICSSIAKVLPGCVATLLSCLVWGGLLSFAMEPVSALNLLRALPVFVLGAVFGILLNYLLACLAFRFTDIVGFVHPKETLLTLLTGSMAPLEVLFGFTPVFLPFTYMVGYPVLICMGRETLPSSLACLIMALWVLAALWLCLAVERRSKLLYEGVGA